MRLALALVGLVCSVGCGPTVADAPAAAAREIAAGRPGSGCAALEASHGAVGSLAALERARLGARCRVARGEAAAAVAEARARRAAAPADAQPHVDLAVALMAQSPRGLAEAQALLRRAAELAPERPDVRFLLGTLLLDDEHPRAALPWLEQAVRLDDRRVGPRLALAQARADVGDAAGARAALGPVPERDPSADEVERGRAVAGRLAGWLSGVSAEAAAAYRQGAALLDGELPGQAVSVLEEVVRARPGFAAAHTLLGLAHVKLGNDARAVAALLRAAELNPEDPTNHTYLGLVYFDRGRAEVAVQHLERALALDPFEPRATAALARLRETAGAPKEAARLFGRLAALDGGEPATLRAWARALRAAGDQAAAERVLARAVTREPSSYEGQLMLGEAYHARFVQAAGAPEARPYAEQARRHLRRALDLHPGDETARRLLRQLDAK